MEPLIDAAGVLGLPARVACRPCRVLSRRSMRADATELDVTGWFRP
jgi:hypothetical protein